MTVRITFNGGPSACPVGTTVHSLLAQRELAGECVAVALDGEVVVPSAWESTTLHDGADVEVLRPLQGG